MVPPPVRPAPRGLRMISSAANFNSVLLAVRVKDTGEANSDYRERFVQVKVNEAPREKKDSFLLGTLKDSHQVLITGRRWPLIMVIDRSRGDRSG